MLGGEIACAMAPRCCEGCDRPGQLQRPRTPDLENSPENSRRSVSSGPKVKCREYRQKTGGKTPEACKTALCRLFEEWLSGCFSSVWPAIYPRPIRHLVRVLSQLFSSLAFEASVAGRGDRTYEFPIGRLFWQQNGCCF